MAVKYRLIERANPQDRDNPKKFYAIAIQDRVFKHGSQMSHVRLEQITRTTQANSTCDFGE